MGFEKYNSLIYITHGQTSAYKASESPDSSVLSLSGRTDRRRTEFFREIIFFDNSYKTVENIGIHPSKDPSNDDLSNESKENEITYEKAWMNIGVILLIVLGIVQKSKVPISLPLLLPSGTTELRTNVFAIRLFVNDFFEIVEQVRTLYGRPWRPLIFHEALPVVVLKNGCIWFLTVKSFINTIMLRRLLRC